MKSKLRQWPGLPGALGVDADRLVAAARPDFVGIRPVVGGLVQVSDLFRAEPNVVPVVDAAAANPDGVAFHLDAIAAGGGDAETAPAKSAGIGEDAGDTADGLALFGFRTRDRAAARANVRLSVRIEDWEGSGDRCGCCLRAAGSCASRAPGARRCEWWPWEGWTSFAAIASRRA